MWPGQGRWPPPTTNGSLHNPGPEPIPLQGWTLSDGNDLHILLSGTIPARGFFLLERTDDHTIADLPADLIYHGSLRNSGERLELRDARGALVDTANADGGGWPTMSLSSSIMLTRGLLASTGGCSTISNRVAPRHTRCRRASCAQAASRSSSAPGPASRSMIAAIRSAFWRRMAGLWTRSNTCAVADSLCP